MAKTLSIDVDLSYKFDNQQPENFKPIPVDLSYPSGNVKIDLKMSKIPKNKISFNVWSEKTNVSLLYTPKRKRTCKEFVHPKSFIEKMFSAIIGAND